MGQRNLIIIVAAVVLGLFAVWLANSWFSSVEEQQERVAAEQDLVRIAVARQELDFGSPLTADNVRMVSWPANSVPAGAFRSSQDLISANRVAIRPIANGEPILDSRISGRAVLSANLAPDARAFSVSINAVTGVAGFVTPGDVVDVLLTRQMPGEGANNDDRMTVVLLENIQVLAVDRRSGENQTDPAVGKTVTLEVDQFGAQKLALASQLGTLSLALRNVESQVVGPTTTVTARDLGGEGYYLPGRPSAPQQAYYAPSAPTAPARTRRTSSGPSMTIFRGTEDTAYEVNRYGE